LRLCHQPLDVYRRRPRRWVEAQREALGTAKVGMRALPAHAYDRDPLLGFAALNDPNPHLEAHLTLVFGCTRSEQRRVAPQSSSRVGFESLRPGQQAHDSHVLHPRPLPASHAHPLRLPCCALLEGIGQSRALPLCPCRLAQPARWGAGANGEWAERELRPLEFEPPTIARVKGPGTS